MTQDLRKNPEVNKPYDYDLDLNWRDDGDILGDASMNDYLKGYKNEPYAFQQWAKNKGINTKVAGQEMINMHFYPEFLADYILTLWNGTDGELQNFYEAFTLRYDNKLKKAVADEIEKLGYKVYPVLVDDRAFYAKKQFSKIVKMAKNKNIQIKLNISKHLFENSEALKLCLGEIDDIQEMGVNVSAKRVSDLLDYYSVIFPEDYAICLTKDLVDEKINDKGYEHYQDFNISDESLKNIERMMDGNQDPYDAPYNGGNTSSTDMGYDYITDMRGFDGVKPEMYETPSVHAKKKRLIADEIGNIPLSQVMDAINEASDNISTLLKQNFANPPAPIRSIRKQTNKSRSNIDDFYTVVNVPDVLDVFEVWKFTLNDKEYKEVFVVISAICTLAGYKKSKWSDVQYRGFYSTVDEAIDKIYGRLA